MNERTKLDEIVDQELQNSPGGEARCTTSFMAIQRIARRAFEHGVDMGSKLLRETLKTLEGGDYFKRVYPKPAPAAPEPPAPPPGFRHTDGRLHRAVLPPAWVWDPHCSKVTHTRDFFVATDGKVHFGDPPRIYILEGPPPVPAYKYTGEFRAPRRFELFWNADTQTVDWAHSQLELPCWILEKVTP